MLMLEENPRMNKHYTGVASHVIILNVQRQQGDFQIEEIFLFLLSLFCEWEIGETAVPTSFILCAVANKAQLVTW